VRLAKKSQLVRTTESRGVGVPDVPTCAESSSPTKTGKRISGRLLRGNQGRGPWSADRGRKRGLRLLARTPWRGLKNGEWSEEMRGSHSFVRSRFLGRDVVYEERARGNGVVIAGVLLEKNSPR